MTAEFNYFMRSVASDEQMMKSIVSVVEDFGWRNIAVVYSADLLSQGNLLSGCPLHHPLPSPLDV